MTWPRLIIGIETLEKLVWRVRQWHVFITFMLGNALWEFGVGHIHQKCSNSSSCGRQIEE